MQLTRLRRILGPTVDVDAAWADFRRGDGEADPMAFALWLCAGRRMSVDQLRTYLSHDLEGPERRFDERTLASLPALISPQPQREARVIDDLATELDPTSEQNRWLLAQGWRSCLTVPLLRRDALLGFLFLDASRPAAFWRCSALASTRSACSRM